MGCGCSPVGANLFGGFGDEGTVLHCRPELLYQFRVRSFWKHVHNTSNDQGVAITVRIQGPVVIGGQDRPIGTVVWSGSSDIMVFVGKLPDSPIDDRFLVWKCALSR